MIPAAPSLNLAPDPGPSPGLGLTEARGGTTPVPAPVPADATPGAGPAAQMTVGVEAIAAPPCQIAVDTLETESTQIPTTVWVCLV